MMQIPTADLQISAQRALTRFGAVLKPAMTLLTNSVKLARLNSTVSHEC
jgi:hypothetical protein